MGKTSVQGSGIGTGGGNGDGGGVLARAPQVLRRGASLKARVAATAAVAVHGSGARSSNFSGGASGKDEKGAARCVSRGGASARLFHQKGELFQRLPEVQLPKKC